MALRLVFMGTPQFSVPTLDALLNAGHQVVAVYSQPPRPSGRGLAPTRSAVHAFAESHGLPILTPTSLKTPDAQDTFRNHQADAAVVVAYGLLLPQAILDATRHGCFNLHASKLPRWRGAAPIQRAIMAGDVETAAMIMHMDAGLDTGPVCASAPMAIAPDMTASQLHDALSVMGGALMAEAMARLEAGELTTTPQSAGGITYAAKIDKAEARIDFRKPAHEVHNQVRGLSPFPGAWFEASPNADGSKPERIKVLQTALVDRPAAAKAAKAGDVLDAHATIACGDGAISLIEVQRAGKKPQAVGDFLRGFPLTIGRTVT